jgi:hypothetical protein
MTIYNDICHLFAYLGEYQKSRPSSTPTMWGAACAGIGVRLRNNRPTDDAELVGAAQELEVGLALAFSTCRFLAITRILPFTT